MSAKGQAPAADVCWADQKMICTFGRFHSRIEELEVEIGKKKEDLEKLVDAADEIYIADDIKVVYGENFVTMDMDGAGELIEEKTNMLKSELEEHESELNTLNERAKVLKGQLYAKFGNNIYLERE